MKTKKLPAPAPPEKTLEFGEEKSKNTNLSVRTSIRAGYLASVSGGEISATVIK